MSTKVSGEARNPGTPRSTSVTGSRSGAVRVRIHRGGAGSVLDLADDLTVGDARADLGREPGDGAGLVRLERLLHLHRLEHDDGVALLHGVAVGDSDLDDGALHGRGDGVAGRCGAGLLAGRALGLLGPGR